MDESFILKGLGQMAPETSGMILGILTALLFHPQCFLDFESRSRLGDSPLHQQQLK